MADLARLVEPATRGDPERPLLWVSKSLDKLASALTEMGHAISPNSVCKLLIELGFSRQANRKSAEGASHPDRNAQFGHINGKLAAAQAAGEPVISVDTKKKAWVGDFKNGGTDYRPRGDPNRARGHDSEDKQLGKVTPYGVYDVAADEGWISVGITADCGGSNGARVRLWKLELQKLADESGLVIHVHHSPPGTSKWNKIEHRLFCRITRNWRGRPLTDRLAVVESIGATTTRTGLKVACALDTGSYEKGLKVSNAEMASLNITGDTLHPEWNYTITPRPTAKS